MRSTKTDTLSTTAALDSAAPLVKAQMEALLQAQAKLLGQIEGFNRAWLSSMREAADSNLDYAARLTRCADPGEASKLCNEWLAARTTAFVNDGQRLSEMWLRACAGAVDSAKTALDDATATASETAKPAGPRATAA